MSLLETSFQSAYPDEFSDSMAILVSRVVQEQLAPILETLREQARMLDLQAALLNHSTVMNRYNVGKLDDIRDFQSNINYKLQFYVHPEERNYPVYHNPPAPVPPPRTEPTPDTASCLLGSASDPIDEPTNSAPPSATASAVESPDRASSPATQQAATPPPSPRFTGEGFTVAASSSRRLQRERPFSVQPDPMWNSTTSINPFLRLVAPAPPPPYVAPPDYVAKDPIPRAESQVAAVNCQLTSPPPSIPHPVSDAETPSPSSHAEGVRRSTADNGHSPLSSSVPTTSVGNPVDPDSALSSQPSEKARGKKRMREEDSPSSDEYEDNSVGGDTFVAGSTSNSSSRRHGPDSKRSKMDTRINVDRLEFIPGSVPMLTDCHYDDLASLEERRRKGEKLKQMQRLFRAGRELCSSG